ncbi:hypothetical protein QBC47DRAFT_359409 [Echria macrotheca]|uniref:Uncharacterized protein n=1 Tax=Echria macrotheca TaxID=438768 RepID=A0AAJ0BEQ4_9PEZI|nr:hypothetical protein QBC47DRAFT_359409 [Echria macrotheca]
MSFSGENAEMRGGRDRDGTLTDGVHSILSEYNDQQKLRRLTGQSGPESKNASEDEHASGLAPSFSKNIQGSRSLLLPQTDSTLSRSGSATKACRRADGSRATRNNQCDGQAAAVQAVLLRRSVTGGLSLTDRAIRTVRGIMFADQKRRLGITRGPSGFQGLFTAAIAEQEADMASFPSWSPVPRPAHPSSLRSRRRSSFVPRPSDPGASPTISPGPGLPERRPGLRCCQVMLQQAGSGNGKAGKQAAAPGTRKHTMPDNQTQGDAPRCVRNFICRKEARPWQALEADLVELAGGCAPELESTSPGAGSLNGWKPGSQGTGRRPALKVRIQSPLEAHGEGTENGTLQQPSILVDRRVVSKPSAPPPSASLWRFDLLHIISGLCSMTGIWVDRRWGQQDPVDVFHLEDDVDAFERRQRDGLERRAAIRRSVNGSQSGIRQQDYDSFELPESRLI